MKALALLWLKLWTGMARFSVRQATRAKSFLRRRGVQFDLPEDADSTDQLAPARGVVAGLIVSAAFWAVVALLWWLL